MKIWSIAIKDGDGEVLSGVGSGFAMQGEAYSGKLYAAGKAHSYYERGENVSVALYQAGSAGTLVGDSYGILYKGDGTNGYLRGDSVSVTKQGTQYRGTLYYKSGDTYYALSSTLYYGDGATEKYYKGDGGYVYGRGTPVTDAYKKGKDVTLQGAEYESIVFKSGENKNVTLQGDEIKETLYKAGQEATLSPAAVTTKSVTALTV